MAEPTEEELEAFKTVKELIVWAQLNEDSGGILTTGLGCEPTDSGRPLGDMPKDEFEAVVGTLQAKNGDERVPPTPFVAASWRLVGRLARLAVGGEKTTKKVAEAAAEALFGRRQSKERRLGVSYWTGVENGHHKTCHSHRPRFR